MRLCVRSILVILVQLSKLAPLDLRPVRAVDFRRASRDGRTRGGGGHLGPSVHLVLQRYRSCQILLEEKDWVTVPTAAAAAADGTNQHTAHCGLLVYVSFSAAATPDSIHKAAQTLLNVGVLTTGLWGDSNKPVSLLTLLRQQQQQSKEREQTASSLTSMTLVPQANLISKVKQQGKSIQYHGQMNKTDGKKFFQRLVQQIRGIILDEMIQLDLLSPSAAPKCYQAWKERQEARGESMIAVTMGTAGTATKPDNSTSGAACSNAPPPASLPPAKLFSVHYADKYAAFVDEGAEDEATRGLPTADAQGNPLTKSAVKRVRKQLAAHAARHEKWKQKQQEGNASAASTAISTNNNDTAESAVASTIVEDDADSNKKRNDNDDGNQSYEDDEQEQHQQQWDDFFLKPPNQSCVMVVAGTFGKRQGLVMNSDMGPFCHTIQIP